MKIYAAAFRHLTPKERFSVLFLVLVRFLLVGFDIAGIFLVGVVVSLVSGTVIAQNSNLAGFLRFIRVFGLENNYIGLACIAVVFFVAKGLLSVALTYLTSNYVARIESAKATHIYRSMLHSTIDLQERFSIQQFLQAIGPAVNSGISQTLTTGTVLIGEFTLLVGISIYLAYTNLLLFIETAIFFGLVGLLMQALLGKASSKSALASYSESIKLQGIVIGSSWNFRQLFVSQSKSSFATKFEKSRTYASRQSAKYLTITSLPRYITEIAVMIGVGLLIWTRGTNDAISASTVAVFLAGLFRIVASMLPIQSGITQMKRVEAESAIAFELLDSFDSADAKNQHQTYIDGPADLVIKELAFRYSPASKLVLNEVNLTIPPGAYVAITGRSGEGKSTLADLILGLRSPSSGSIAVSGISPRQVANLGYVPQKTSLFEGTLRENLTLDLSDSDHSAKDHDLKQLIDSVGLTDLVSSLPLGLDTQVGQGGVELSGGQTQRVGIIRALYNKPALLVMDEATSALDGETESLIKNLLGGLRGKVTLLVIAHRPETIAAADMHVAVANTKAEIK